MLEQIHSLKIKIIILLSVLISVITIIMSLIFIADLDKLVSSNIKLFSTTLISNEKKELQNKIDLASNILNVHYQETKPKYIEKTVKKILISHQQQLFSQLNSFYNLNKDKYSKQKLKDKLKLLVKYARYGSNGYFWINDMDYKMVMHPIRPEYDKNIFISTPKVPFVELGVNSLKNTNKNQEFIKYRFYNPATKKYEFKVSLVRVFKPYNWVIGTGQYLSDITPMVKEQALEDIKSLRYGNNGYFWVNDIDYKMVMHPIKPEYNGKTFINTPKVPFVELGVNAIKKSGNDTAIIEYSFYNPATQKYERKMSVVKLFKPWNWIIGTGVYLNAIDNSIEQVKVSKDNEETKFILSAVLFTILIIIATILTAYYLTVHFIVKPMSGLLSEKKYFEEISQIDYLTNILNRRAFFKAVDKYLAYARRNNLSVSVIMIDIDHFKNVNDTYGHEAGDCVLKDLAETIENCIREEDIFGRLGGEEFGLCILNDDDSTLCTIAQKVRKAVEERVVTYKGVDIKFTISLGGYRLTSKTEKFEMALNKADEALYMAKNSGRNKVILHGELACS